MQTLLRFGFGKISQVETLSLFNLFGLLNWTSPDFLLIGWLPLFGRIVNVVSENLIRLLVILCKKKELFAFFPVVITIILAPFLQGYCSIGAQIIYYKWGNNGT